MLRAALFTFVGAAYCARSLQSFSDPAFTDPDSASDWFAVLSYSAAFLALGIALPLFAQLVGETSVFRVSLVAAVGAALSGLSNVLEDALQMDFAVWPYIGGAVLTLVGLVVLTIVVLAAARGSRRLLAAVPAATLVGLLMFESGGGVLVLAAWLAAAAVTISSRMPAPAEPAQARSS